MAATPEAKNDAASAAKRAEMPLLVLLADTPSLAELYVQSYPLLARWGDMAKPEKPAVLAELDAVAAVFDPKDSNSPLNKENSANLAYVGGLRSHLDRVNNWEKIQNCFVRYLGSLETAVARPDEFAGLALARAAVSDFFDLVAAVRSGVPTLTPYELYLLGKANELHGWCQRRLSSMEAERPGAAR